jgi:biopolymer transport protein ExbB
LIELIVRGGIFMYPIIFCSVVALSVLIERLWVLRRRNVIPDDFVRSVEDLVRKQKISEALYLSQSDSSSIGRIFFAGLKNAERGLWLVKEAIQDIGNREAIVLEKRIGILSTIANLSPLLGLLGTVSGMIRSFNALSMEGLGGQAQLALGIGEALITTAAGLCVAIPTLVIHRILKDKAESLIFELEESSARLIETIQRHSTRE